MKASVLAVSVLLLGLAASFPLKPAAAGGTQWALLIAGSKGYENYRHQADIYHAYQIMKAGGLSDDHIVVMHTDDIANARQNPHKGTVINSPNGTDVYHGVPKDYIGSACNKKNFLAALRGDSSATSGGSGKVINSGPNDDVFVYFADHGGPGILGMPSGFLWSSTLSAKDLNAALHDKVAKNGFRQLVFYVEACESGSIFEGQQLPTNVSIYATTAANGQESSWGTYCPGMKPAPPKEYSTCLGDLYSIAWMEDTDAHNRATETWQTQFERVRDRVSQNGTFSQGSHVQQFGELDITSEDISIFLGNAPAHLDAAAIPSRMDAVAQRDAEMIHFHAMVAAASNEAEQLEAQQELTRQINIRAHIDSTFTRLATEVLGENGLAAITAVRNGPVVDDWDCYMGNFRAYEEACGAATQYAFKYGRLLANMCNSGYGPDAVASAAKRICAH